MAVNAIEGCSSSRSTKTILPAWSLRRTVTGAGRRCTVLPISQINSPDQFAVKRRQRPTIEVSYHCTVSAMEIFARMTGAPGLPSSVHRRRRSQGDSAGWPVFGPHAAQKPAGHGRARQSPPPREHLRLGLRRRRHPSLGLERRER